jgi:hypothetical protein
MPTAYHCYYTDTWKKHFCLHGSRAYYLVILCQQHIILTECRPTAYYMTSICKQNIVVLYMPTAYRLAVCVRSLLFCQCVSTAYWYDLTVDIYIYQQHTTLLFRMTACVSQELLQIRSFAYNTPYYVDSRVNSILPGQFAATGTSVEYLSIWFGYVKEIYFEKMCHESIITCRHCLKHIIVTLFLHVSTELLFDNTKGRKYLAL